MVYLSLVAVRKWSGRYSHVSLGRRSLIFQQLLMSFLLTTRHCFYLTRYYHLNRFTHPLHPVCIVFEIGRLLPSNQG